MTFAQRKQHQESKRLHSAASTTGKQSNSAKVKDATTANDSTKNTQSQEPQCNKTTKSTNNKENENITVRKKQDSGEKCNERKGLEKNARKVNDLGIGADFPGKKSNSREITSKMNVRNLDEHFEDQTNDSFDNNTNSTQKDKYSINKMSNKNHVENSKIHEQTFENDVTSNEMKITDSEESEGISDSEKENEDVSDIEKEIEKRGQELENRNLSDVMSETVSFNSECVFRKSRPGDHDTPGRKEDNVSTKNYEDKDDNQNHTNNKGHNIDQHIKDNKTVQENRKYTLQQDPEHSHQDLYDTECMNEKQGDNSEDDTTIEEKQDTMTSYEDHSRESNYQEHDETSNHYTENELEGSHDQYESESNEATINEGDQETHPYKNNKDNADFEDIYGIYNKDGNEVEHKEVSNMESDYKQDNDYGRQDNEENCEVQTKYNENEGDYVQYDEGAYEGQDSEDNYEEQLNYEYDDTTDYDQQNEDEYEEQDNTKCVDNEGNDQENYEQENYEESYYEVQDNTDSRDENLDNYYEDNEEEPTFSDYEKEDSGDYELHNDDK